MTAWHVAERAGPVPWPSSPDRSRQAGRRKTEPSCGYGRVKSGERSPEREAPRSAGVPTAWVDVTEGLPNPGAAVPVTREESQLPIVLARDRKSHEGDLDGNASQVLRLAGDGRRAGAPVHDAGVVRIRAHSATDSSPSGAAPRSARLGRIVTATKGGSPA